MIPMLLTACVGSIDKAEPEEISLIPLEAELAYLDHQLEDVYQKL